MLKKLASGGLLFLFFCGICVTLSGLSASQDWCRSKEGLATVDPVAADDAQDLVLDATIIGGECHDAFRFPWLVISLDFIPVIVGVLGLLQPEIAKGSAVALLAVMTPLNMLLADSFYTKSVTLRNQIADPQSGHEILGHRFSTILAGFAIMVCASLLIILMDPILDSVESKATPDTSAAAAPAAPTEKAALRQAEVA